MSLFKYTTFRTVSSRLCTQCLCQRTAAGHTLRSQRNYSTEPPPASPLLLKLRNDLKASIKSHDTNRLSVLRGMLADITNASKSSSPVKTDMQVLALLRKRSAASKAAAVEFNEAGRKDLKEKEDAQLLILDEYAGGVQTIDEDEIRTTVEQIFAEMSSRGDKVDKPTMLKKTIAPGGVYDGKNVEKATVVKIVQEVLSGEAGKKA